MAFSKRTIIVIWILVFLIIISIIIYFVKKKQAYESGQNQQDIGFNEIVNTAEIAGSLSPFLLLIRKNK